jgi:hypothetical protein
LVDLEDSKNVENGARFDGAKTAVAIEDAAMLSVVGEECAAGPGGTGERGGEVEVEYSIPNFCSLLDNRYAKIKGETDPREDSSGMPFCLAEKD